MVGWADLIAMAIFAGIGVSILSVAAGVDRLRRLCVPAERSTADVVLILPLTGSALDLDVLVDRLRAQTLVPRRLIITVESEEDPAYRRALSIKAPVEFPIEIVVAGLATDQAQKCRNLQAALDRAGAENEIIALMDGDICPAAGWLDALVAPLVANEFDVVTGRRWQQVTKGRLGAHLVAVIDRALALTPRLEFEFAHVVWGGSLALKTRTAADMSLRSSLDHTLSDDLAIADRALRTGLRVVTRSGLLVPSPTDIALGSAWRFGRRQYQLCRIYRPELWLLALVAINLRLLAWALALFLGLTAGTFIWAILLLAVLGAVKQILTDIAARRAGVPDPVAVRVVQIALGVFQLLPDLFHSSVIIGAAWCRTVRWAHVTYEVAGPDRIRVKERRPFTG